MKMSKGSKRKFEHWQVVRLLLMVYDFAAVIVSFGIALWLRFDCKVTSVEPQYLTTYTKTIIIYALFCLVVFWFLRLYKSIWRFASYSELLRVILATVVTGVIYTGSLLVFNLHMPISYYVIGITVQFIATLGIRFFYRFVLLLRGRTNNEVQKKNVMIIGAGSAGQMLFRDIKHAKETNETVACFIDDNPNKWDRYIDDVPVFGSRDHILEAVDKFNIDKIYVAVAKKNKDVVLIADCLNQSVALGSILGAKIMRVPSIGIVTDLPDLLLGRKDRIKNFIIRLYDQYILLTEQMNDYIISNITHKKKPYIIVEGMVDINMKNRGIYKQEKYSKKICMYTGILDCKYGIEILVKGFNKANIPNSELHIYGNGDFKNELLKLSKKNKNIKYFGLKPNNYIVEEQQKATLLINPRPSNEEFTKYSFPSKNMEYMVSGTPTLLTKLPGMPKEYLEYVYVLENESVDGMAEKLIEILNLSPEELKEKGKLAKEYVLNNKSNKNQAQRIIKWLANDAGESI